MITTDDPMCPLCGTIAISHVVAWRCPGCAYVFETDQHDTSGIIYAWCLVDMSGRVERLTRTRHEAQSPAWVGTVYRITHDASSVVLNVFAAEDAGHADPDALNVIDGPMLEIDGSWVTTKEARS